MTADEIAPTRPIAPRPEGPLELTVACDTAGSPEKVTSTAAPSPSSSPTAHERGRSLGRLPGLDGLRAVAVLAVLGYHAELTWLPGGFLGVDVFFVISGFLITSLLLAEHGSTGRIDLPAFWLRRARRLLPALFLVLASTLTVAVLLVPDEVARLRGDTLAALGYVTNWWLILRQQSYFEAIGRPSPLLHLWSLAVEEQFYVLWPVLLSIALVVLRRGGTFVLVLAGAAGSALLMAALYSPNGDPSRVYYGTDTHAVGLLVGAALAFAWSWWNARERARAEAVAGIEPLAAAQAIGDDPVRSPKRPGNPAARLVRGAWRLRWDVVAIVGLVVVGLFFTQLDEAEPLLYRGGFAVLAIATAAVIAAVVNPMGHVGTAILDRQPLRWIGERSYGIYLWHWPIFTFTRPELDVQLTPLPDLALRLALTLACAEVSYRFLEMPVRRGALGRTIARWRDERRTHGIGAWGRQLAGGALALGLGVALAARVAGAAPPATPSYLAITSIHEGAPAVAAVMPSAAPAAASTPGAGATAGAGPSGSPGRTPGVTPPPDASGVSIVGPASPYPSTAPQPLRGSVFAVGDSVMLGAVPELHHTIPNLQVDAQVGRSFIAGLALLEQRIHARTLPDTVIVALGDNGWITSSQMDQLMTVLGGRRRVIYVNLKEPHSWEGHDNQVIADVAARYPNVTVADWHDASVEHPDYFWDDGTHLRPQGAAAYAKVVATAVRQAATMPLPGAAPTGSPTPSAGPPSYQSASHGGATESPRSSPPLSPAATQTPTPSR